MARIKYNINLDKFNTLSEETCYWIGFIAADGCIFDYGNGNVGFTLALNEQDKEHILKFQNFIEDKRELYYNEKNKTYVLTIKRREIVDILQQYGIFPAKSLTITAPDFLQNDEQKKWWIRGYIDGDGSLAISSAKGDYMALEVGIVGTPSVLDFIKPFAKTNAKLYQKKGQNSYSLTIQGNHKVYEFIHWLYDNAIIYLNRKFEIFNTMNNMYKSFYKERARKNVLSEETINNIIYDLLISNDPMTQIAIKYNVSYTTIKTINSGKYHHKEYLLYPIRKNIQQNLEKFIKL